MRRTNRNEGMKAVFYVLEISQSTSNYDSSHRMPYKTDFVLFIHNLQHSIYLYRKSSPTILNTLLSFTNIRTTYVNFDVVP
jgi:hypothetical protein